MAPPAPPPPPIAPDLMTVVSVSVFGFAEAHPVIYLMIDLSLFLAAATFFLFLKDIQDWMEARRLAAMQAEQEAAAKEGGYK